MKKQKMLDIILPVYNEKKSISIVLNEWEMVLKKRRISHNFIICEDGSTDGTKQLLNKLKLKYPITLNQKSYRRGYGPAVIDGIYSSNSEYVLCIDSDGQCDPSDIVQFWKNRHNKTVLIGRRVKREDSTGRLIYSKLFLVLFKILFRTSIHDPSAPFVLFKTSAIKPHVNLLKYMREGFWWGFVATCIKKGINVRELAVNHRQRIDGKTQVYSLNKMPSIAARNIIGLFLIRFV